MDKGLELSNLVNEDLLELYKKTEEYIAFLDSDDIWLPYKLERQIKYMEERSSIFCCTLYERINKEGKCLGEIVNNSDICSYDDLLRNCPGNSTVIYNANVIGKKYALDIKKRNDYVLWLEVIKSSKRLDCFEEVLSYYREYEGSISSNKFQLIKYHWYIYRKIEKLCILRCCSLIIYWCFKGVVRKWKRQIEKIN